MQAWVSQRGRSHRVASAGKTSAEGLAQASTVHGACMDGKLALVHTCDLIAAPHGSTCAKPARAATGVFYQPCANLARNWFRAAAGESAIFCLQQQRRQLHDSTRYRTPCNFGHTGCAGHNRTAPDRIGPGRPPQQTSRADRANSRRRHQRCHGPHDCRGIDQNAQAALCR